MLQDNYITINIDFSEEELIFVDEYAAYCGEERETLLQRLLQEVIEDIKVELASRRSEASKYGE